MAEIVYILCMILSCACAFFLYKAYKKAPSALLLWSSACFGFLAINNGVLVLDMLIYPEVDFGGDVIRAACGATAGGLLLFGLIWELS